MDKNLKNELKFVFEPPKPDKKEEFLNGFSYLNLNKKSFWLIQIKFIRKRFWILSFLFLVFCILGANIINLEKDYLITISSSLPILSILGITEIQRSFFYKMYELEMSCKYSLKEIFIIKTTIIFTVYFIICLILSIFTINIFNLDIMKTLFLLLTPFLLCNYLYLMIISKFKSRESINIFILIYLFILLINNILNNKINLIYETYEILCKLIIPTITTIIIIKIKKLSKEMRSLKWNF